MFATHETYRAVLVIPDKSIIEDFSCETLKSVWLFLKLLDLEVFDRAS